MEATGSEAGLTHALTMVAPRGVIVLETTVAAERLADVGERGERDAVVGVVVVVHHLVGVRVRRGAQPSASVASSAQAGRSRSARCTGRRSHLHLHELLFGG